MSAEYVHPEQVVGYEFEPQAARYTERDVSLYALGIGATTDPLTPALHAASTRSGPDTRNIGAPMTGSTVLSVTNVGKGLGIAPDFTTAIPEAQRSYSFF